MPSAQPNDSVIIWNMKSYQTNNPKETQALAEQLAKLVYPGLVVTLQGDLGAGKTTFTQGLAKALGITSRVKSPTFNILNTYEEGRIPLYHFDAYRLENMGAADQGFEDYLGTDGVTLIEWPQYMADLLPNDRLEMTFTRMAGADSDREIVVRGLGQAAQIEEDLHG
ncbi:tRNA A37 threonylcarbamoyladenosine biosynthesis protein TsaE (TsaE) [Fructobacillus evanidus]|nr:tRNA A37 threonylcarbamoyladenosine biosynthesis protein TsaE (TsaE) [Fructobacillus sp. LMG 32999]CAK1229011.1 tRNA A37 threonylcarbamoyladenosine biosynthesis protein TsaE (TsaE) [Fructobacillus sp. LMG 32999]